MSKLTTVQQEQLVSLGLYLQSVRKEQERSLDEVATQIFIRPILLKALEEGDTNVLPEPVFIQGFLRRYGDALGLEGTEIAKQFESTLVGVLPDPAAAQADSAEGVVAPQDRHQLKVIAPVENSRPLSFSSQGSRRSAGWGTWVAGLVVLAVVGGGLWVAFAQGGDRLRLNLAETPIDPPPSDTEPDPAPSEATAPEPEPPAAAPLSDPVTVTVTLTGDSWLRVTTDGEQVYEGILRNGMTETWTAQEELVLSSGNAGAVQISYNGSEAAPLGDLGSVERRTFSPNTDSPNTDAPDPATP